MDLPHCSPVFQPCRVVDTCTDQIWPRQCLPTFFSLDQRQFASAHHLGTRSIQEVFAQWYQDPSLSPEGSFGDRAAGITGSCPLIVSCTADLEASEIANFDVVTLAVLCVPNTIKGAGSGNLVGLAGALLRTSMGFGFVDFDICSDLASLLHARVSAS